MILAVVFGYLALQAVRNINLFRSCGWVCALLEPGRMGRRAAVLSCGPRASRQSCCAAGLVARVILLAIIGVLIFMIVSGQFFRSTGERRRFGTMESPLAYAHEAARFAAATGTSRSRLGV